MDESARFQLLIADDDPQFRQTLCAILEPFVRFVEAKSGEEAIELAGMHRFDLALLDMHMQVLTGLETLRVLKQVNAVAPCILITADVTEGLLQHAADANAFSVLAKPVSRRILVATVSAALQSAYGASWPLQAT